MFTSFSRRGLLSTAFIGALLVFAGCTSQSVYLQDVSVEGPQVQPPLFITKQNREGDFRAASRISINDKTNLVGRATGHSLVNTRGVYQVDTVTTNGKVQYFERNGVNTKTFEGRNFFWQPTNITGSLDCEYVVAKNFSVVGGVSYSSGSSRSFLGANAGVGFFFEGRSIAVRVDIGAHWNSLRTDVEYVVTTTPFSFGSRETEVKFFRDQRKDSYTNAYGAVTFNTMLDRSPVQFFTQLAINRQTVVDFTRSTEVERDNVVQESVSFFLVTPGIALDLTSDTRVLLGLQLRDETALLEAEPGVLLAPFVQFEFGL